MQYGIRPEGPEYYAHLGLAGTLFHVPGATRLALAPGFHIPRLCAAFPIKKLLTAFHI
jgi:hypothetical protein